MRTMLVVLCMGAAILPLATGAGAQEKIMMYGYSYFTPPEDVGTVTTVVGMLEPPIGFTYPFTVNFNAYEYTYYFQAVITAVVPGPFSTDYFYADAELFIYEDPAKNADYGIDPPNATAPSTFREGTVALHGTLTNLFRSDDPFGFFDPTLIGDCSFDGGTKLGELLQGEMWTITGGLILADPSTPPGYGHAWVTEVFFTGPVAVEHSTWGGIKALYGE